MATARWRRPDRRPTGRVNCARPLVEQLEERWTPTTPPPQIAGQWFISGNKPTQIQQNGGNLTFINENGQSSPGSFQSQTQVVATAWGNLVGTLVPTYDGLRIAWSNGTAWDQPQLTGQGFIGSGHVQVSQNGSSLTFTNEKGNMSAGMITDATHVVATGWGNLVGTLTPTFEGYRINWANSSAWDMPRLAGTWSINGQSTQIASSLATGLDIKAAYTYSDLTELIIENTASAPITGITLSGIGTSGSITGSTGSVSLGDLASGGSITFFFYGQPADIFHYSFDDYFTGEVTYTLTGTFQSQRVSTTFSPSVNASGGFVGFLGNGPDGREVDIPFDPVLVAHIMLGAQVGNGTSLVFTNEFGSTSPGSIQDLSHVVATGWGNLVGTLVAIPNNQIAINWSNGTSWTKPQLAQ
jgi:hypothetical protein